MKEFKVNSRACTLDLEMNQPSGRIIQIGAVVGDAYFKRYALHVALAGFKHHVAERFVGTK